jgi:hypothetical protein
MATALQADTLDDIRSRLPAIIGSGSEELLVEGGDEFPNDLFAIAVEHE